MSREIDFSDQPEMHVSAEALDQARYIEACGGLKRERTTRLRSPQLRTEPWSNR